LKNGFNSENLSKLVELWITGVLVDWNRLYTSKPRRISLPTYPFANERYWVDQKLTTNLLSSYLPSLPQQKHSEQPSSSVIQASLQTISTPPASAEALFSAPLDKPNQMALPALSDNQIVSNKLNSSGKPKGIVLAGLSAAKMPSSINQTKPTREFIVPKPSIALEPTETNKSVNQTALPSMPESSGVESLRAELTISLAEALYMKPSEVDLDIPFIDLGLDSIIAVEWIRVLNKQYELNIAATKVYDYPNLREFTVFLAKQFNQSDTSLPSQSVKTKSVPSLSAPKPDTDSSQNPLNQTVLDSLESYPLESSLPAELTNSLAEALYMKPGDIDPDVPFIDLGLDSIIAVEWIRVLNKTVWTQYGGD
jgi:polyketide synthase PksN